MDQDAAVGLVIFMCLVYGAIPLGVVEVILIICAWFFSFSFWWVIAPLGIYLFVPLMMYIIHKLGILDGS